MLTDLLPEHFPFQLPVAWLPPLGFHPPTLHLPAPCLLTASTLLSVVFASHLSPTASTLAQLSPLLLLPRSATPTSCRSRFSVQSLSLPQQLLPTRPASSRKEVIQPHLPVRLPCYDFVPVIRPTLGSSSLAVRSPTSGVSNSHDVTGGVYKARERIHRSMADLRLLATPASCRRVAACNLNYERLWWDSLQVAPSLPIVPPIVACV